MSPLLRRLPALALALGISLGASAAELTVSAAASLTHALREIAPLFQAAQPGTTLRLNFAASGALMQQIDKGAPVDVFASADPHTMDQAQARGFVKPAARRDVLANTLVVVVPAASPRMPAALDTLAQADYRRIAIGLPASVPAGRYTREALEQAGLWAALAPKIVGAHHVRQALDYVARGEVDAAFVYATDAALMPAKVKVALTVPTATPIVYPVAVLAASPNAAAAARFVDFLFAPAAQAVFAKHGFRQP